MESWLLWSIALLVVGLLISAIEVMVPSGGLLSIAALACLIGSAICAYQHSPLAMGRAYQLFSFEGQVSP